MKKRLPSSAYAPINPRQIKGSSHTIKNGIFAKSTELNWVFELFPIWNWFEHQHFGYYFGLNCDHFASTIIWFGFCSCPIIWWSKRNSFLAIFHIIQCWVLVSNGCRERAHWLTDQSCQTGQVDILFPDLNHMYIILQYTLLAHLNFQT